MSEVQLERIHNSLLEHIAQRVAAQQVHIASLQAYTVSTLDHDQLAPCAGSCQD